MEKEKRDSDKTKTKPKRAPATWYLPDLVQNLRHRNTAILLGLSFILACLLTPSFVHHQSQATNWETSPTETPRPPGTSSSWTRRPPQKEGRGPAPGTHGV